MKNMRNCIVNQKEIADDFYEAYRRCFEGKNLHRDEYGRMVSSIVAIPGFVNGLFACELYFKFLLGNKVNQLKGKDRHNLKSLFYILDESYKKELSSVKCDPRYTLDGLLSDIGEGFISWRYLFEDGNENFGQGRPFEFTEYFLKTYLQFIEKIASKVFKEKINDAK